jgi:hypothetical protein
LLSDGDRSMLMGNKRNVMFRPTILFLTAIGLIGPSLSAADSRTHRGSTPPWAGQWIWAPRSDQAPRLEVDLQRWLTQRPGGWGKALVNRLIGMASVSGLSGVDWHLQSADGQRLYPSNVQREVLHWRNWGANFAAFDFPAHAIDIAKKCELPIRLIARSAAVATEARQRYPDTPVLRANRLKDQRQLAAVEQSVSELAGRWLSHQPHWFKRTFTVEQPVQSASLSITAQKRYRLYLDGKLIGRDSGWWRAETYDLTELLSRGEHTLTVRVVPDADYAGLLINMRWQTKGGQTHQRNTGSAWRCRQAAADPEQSGDIPTSTADGDGWNDVSVVGFRGIGPRFRLKPPWQYPTPVHRASPLPDRLVTNLHVQASGNANAASAVVDGSLGDRASWQSQVLPSRLTLALKESIRIREIRVHSGHLNRSGAGSLKHYRLEGLSQGRWRLLVSEVEAAPPYRGQPRQKFVQHHAFSPRSVEAVRLIVQAVNPASPGQSEGTSAGPSASQRRAIIREVELIKAWDEK